MNQLTVCPYCNKRLVPTPAEIKATRTRAGLSQTQFANMLGVQASYIAYLENGQRNPSGTLILRYRKVEKQLQRKGGSKMTHNGRMSKTRAK